MKRSERFALPLLAAVVGFSGSTVAALYLHREARLSLDEIQRERLEGAAAAGALLLGTAPAAEQLRAFADAHRLDGAYLVDQNRMIVADAHGKTPRPLDLLRADPEAIDAALGGALPAADRYAFGGLEVASLAYPIAGGPGFPARALVLEVGDAFGATRERLDAGKRIALGLCLLSGAAIAAVAAGWARSRRASEGQRLAAARGEVMTRMAALAAHEIRNPLGIIRGTVELFRERHRSGLPERDAAALADVLTEVDRLRALTEELLDLARERPLQREPLQLDALAREVCRGVAQRFPSARLEVVGEASAPIKADRVQLHRALQNLIQNAAQSKPEAKVAVEVATGAGGLATVRVTDDGGGIPPGMQTRLFEPFATGKVDGTGLGLFLARRVAEAHGGGLRLVGTGPSGTAFELQLPAGSGES